VPAYEAARDDSEIYADLRMRLNANPALSAVQVQVDRGAVRLSGDVPTAADKAKADEIARGTPGVIHVDNRVVLSADTELVGRITAALLADPRTANIPIEVIADRGVATLEGTVPSLEVKIAAEEIAQSVPGVVTVINELEVPHEEPKLRSIAVPLPRTG
jgi:osmotically-inducible protein OsmY